jgi:hypothetical protein
MALTFSDPLVQGYFAFTIAMGITCCATTALRFLSARRANRKTGLEDLFALFALLSYLVYIALCITGSYPVVPHNADDFSANATALLLSCRGRWANWT